MRICGWVIAAVTLVAAAAAGAGDREQYPVDTPLYTLRGPESPSMAIIPTAEEVEYIGDYLGLDEKRARSALKLLGHVDFAESMLLVVNGGPVEGAMLRVDAVYEEDGVLHVAVVTTDPPQQYFEGDESSAPASREFTPALVTVLPRFQGRVVVHAYDASWAVGGDLRGIELLVTTAGTDGSEGGQDGPGDDG